MPRTFSLARLLLGITAFCLLCGLFANFPNEALIAVLPIPTLIVYYALLRYSRRPLLMTIAALTGALLGFLYCNALGGLVFPFVIPKAAVNQEVKTCLFVYSNVVYIISVAITPALGALILGGTLAFF